MRRATPRGTHYSDIRYSDTRYSAHKVMGVGKFRPQGAPKRISMSSYGDTTGGRPTCSKKSPKIHFWRPFVKRFALCYRSVVCPVCLSVGDVRALWPNGWTDQDETWRAGRPRPWSHCVRWGPSCPSAKGAQPPIFGPYLLRPNGCMDRDVTWYGGRPHPPPTLY